MRNLTNFITILIVLALFGLPQKAYAYIDPGTGSFIFQLIIAILFGTSFIIKKFWRRIKNFFANLFLKIGKV